MATLPNGLPALLVPFFSLSYPADTPGSPDSFPVSRYHTTGPLDACIVVSCIALMAVLRDFLRLVVLEPFARWHLTRDHRRHQSQHRSPALANGNANGSIHRHHHPPANGDPRPMSKREAHLMHRSVLRFAEQGWPAIYYSVQWTFGFVCLFPPFFLIVSLPKERLLAVHSP